jgi:hypothetical protein
LAVHFLFWFLFFAMPVAALALVLRVVVGLWRRGLATMRQVGDIGERMSDAMNAASRSPDHPSGRRRRA